MDGLAGCGSLWPWSEFVCICGAPAPHHAGILTHQPRVPRRASNMIKKTTRDFNGRIQRPPSLALRGTSHWRQRVARPSAPVRAHRPVPAQGSRDELGRAGPSRAERDRADRARLSGVSGAKRGRAGPSGAKRDQAGPSGAERSRTGPNSASSAFPLFSLDGKWPLDWKPRHVSLGWVALGRVGSGRTNDMG